MTIKLVDANNVLRRKFESGRSVMEAVPFCQPTFSSVWWIFDGKGALQSRKDIYPGYKEKRDRKTPTHNGAYTFLSTVRDELLPHTDDGNLIVRIPGFEADDVIAWLANFFARHDDVFIDSNDVDFFTLTHNPRIKLADIPNWVKELVAPKDMRLYKTLCGDSSDNIPGLKGFGDESWKKLSEHEKGLWVEWFQGETLGSDIDAVIRSRLKPSQKDWFDAGGAELLRKFWEIIGFFEVGSELINNHTLRGDANNAAYHEVLRKYMWNF